MLKQITQPLIIGLFILLFVFSCQNKEDVIDVITNSEIEKDEIHFKDFDVINTSVNDVLNRIYSEIDTLVNIATTQTQDLCNFETNYSDFVLSVPGTFQKNITFVFNNQQCEKWTTIGTITGSLVTTKLFDEKDARFEFSFSNYSLTVNGVSLTINGIQKVTNVSGGFPNFVIDKPEEFGSVKHQVKGVISIKFENSNTIKNWDIDQEITWTNKEGKLVSTIVSNRISNGLSNANIVGTNRFGDKFYLQTLLPLNYMNNCVSTIPISGKQKNTIFDVGGSLSSESERLITQVVDSCASGYTITTTNKRGVSRTKIINF